MTPKKMSDVVVDEWLTCTGLSRMGQYAESEEPRTLDALKIERLREKVGEAIAAADLAAHERGFREGLKWARDEMNALAIDAELQRREAKREA